MATTPPAGTMQSTAGISRASCPISTSDRTPILCVPGSTRRGPLSASESSICRRYATTRERCGRCVGVRDSGLDGPRPPAGNVTPVAQRERRVLVPDNQPVASGRLVEQRGAKRYRLGANKTCRDRHESGVARKLLDEWNVHQVPCAGTVSFESGMLEHGPDISSFGLIRDNRHDLEAVCHAQ
jgi:hypothetical protein